MNEHEKSSKTISIRGVDADVYELFADRVKESDMNMGDAITAMMNGVLSDFDEVFDELPTSSAKKLRAFAGLPKSSIQHQSYLRISKQDLEEAGERFSFQHIRELVFEPDVDRETFEKYVRSVQHCSLVKLPRILPKLKMYSKIMHCRDIIFYEGNPEDVELNRNQSSRRRSRKNEGDIPPEAPELAEPLDPFEDDFDEEL